MMLVLMSILIANAGTSTAEPQPCAERPVKLVARAVERGTALEVVGSSPVRLQVRYRLEVESGSGNNINQASRAELVPGIARVLSTVRVGSSDYRARLTVDCGGASYVLTSPEA